MTNHLSRAPALRRPLLKVTTASAGLLAVAVTSRVASNPQDRQRRAATVSPAFTQASDRGDVTLLRLPLGDDILPRVGSDRSETARLPTSPHSMVAVTWPLTAVPPRVLVRSRRGSRWGDWARLPALHDAPEDTDDRRSSITGTELMWIGRADGLQVRIDGQRPDGLAAVLLHPRRRAGDQHLALFARADMPRRGRTRAEAPRPRIVSRQEWGADESLRSTRPTYNHTVKQVHVHHTVNANNYAPEDVPALIRGMYAYHTASLGWSDLGYNFLVDRFGRAFVGRAGGPARLVRGAHTLGFNAESVGVAAIGNFDSARPSGEMLDTIAALAAWKLDPFDRDTLSTVRVQSEGSDKFGSGATPTLPVIDGHRDTNDTACPGSHLYDALDSVRSRTARLLQHVASNGITIREPAVIVNASDNGDAGAVRPGDLLAVLPGSYLPTEATASFRWLRDGDPIAGGRDISYQVRPRDLGGKIACRVTLATPGSEPAVRDTPPLGPVLARPGLEIATSSDRRAVRVTTFLSPAPPVRTTPTGVITVRVGDRSKAVTLEAGSAVVRFGRHRRFKPGSHPVLVRYLGDEEFEPVQAGTAVVVS